MWYCAKLALLISIFYSFLSDQYQRVVVNGAQSSRLPVLSGVPQGTLLGPLLFLIYINDIVLGIDSEIRLFVDDYILYRQIRNSCHSASLQSDISKLHEWLYKWQMSFNVSKCCIFPPQLFVVLPSPLVQLMATHFVSCPLKPILTSTPSILVPLLIGMPCRHL